MSELEDYDVEVGDFFIFLGRKHWTFFITQKCKNETAYAIEVLGDNVRMLGLASTSLRRASWKRIRSE